MKSLRTSVALLALIAATPALATNTSITVKDSTGTTQSMQTQTNAGVQTWNNALTDFAGAAFGVNANPIFVSPATGATFSVTGTVALGSGAATIGSIANTSFGISGTLPAFASTPAFTISGTLPAFASTPTFNLGTLNGAATAANQTSVIGTASAGTAATNSLLSGCIYNSAAPTLSTGQQVADQCDINGNRKVTVANTNANGSATSANSSPVVIASDQAAVAVKTASGAIASGSVASGAFASGSIASGAIASGAFASGSISANAAASGAFPAGSISDLAHGQSTMTGSVPVAIASDQSAVATKAASGAYASGAFASGSMVDITNLTGTKAAGTAASNSLLGGGVYSSTPPSLSNGNQVATQVDVKGAAIVTQTGAYAPGTTAETASATGTTAATTATLAAGGVGITTYICGFSIRANATSAATGNATVTGTITGTLNFTQWTAPAASGLGVTEELFNPCVPASTTNTAIAVVSAAPGTGGVVSVSAWGYVR